jgi:hypothetical protein
METVTAPNLALYQIESRLSELLEMRNAAVEDEASPEVLAAIDEQFAQYFAREVKKVDGICHALCAFEDAADQAELEADRIAERAKRLRLQYDRIKAATLKAMQDHGVRVLETPTNKLRVCGNGGLEPLEVTSVGLEYQDCVVALPAVLWGEIMREIPGHLLGEVALGYNNGTLQPSGGRIRAALKRGEEVPGAKLLPRGFHLRVG